MIVVATKTRIANCDAERIQHRIDFVVMIIIFFVVVATDCSVCVCAGRWCRSLSPGWVEASGKTRSLEFCLVDRLTRHDPMNEFLIFLLHPCAQLPRASPSRSSVSLSLSLLLSSCVCVTAAGEGRQRNDDDINVICCFVPTSKTMSWKASISRHLPILRFFACSESPSSRGVL